MTQAVNQAIGQGYENAAFSPLLHSAQTQAALAQLQAQTVQVPEMEKLGGDLHDIASRMSLTADSLEAKISRFLSEGQTAAAPASVLQAAEPPPGTLASLHMAEKRLRSQQERLLTLVGKVKDIL